MTAIQNPQVLDKSVLETFIQECLQAKAQKNTNNNPLYWLITQTQYALTQTTPLDTQQKGILERLTRDLEKPMKIAIIGQFSSGKSTFLNALLGQEILPSGITPVTAKVCEITYGDEVQLDIFYKNGRQISKPIHYLNEVDEMENMKIAYYKLSVPLLLLKEISFLDTPGFNSQNESDTETTNSILEEVDGIIWLTLIDNVGKNSEKEILQTHIRRYASKSLCVLNQKDRLKNQSEIDTSLEYAKKAFEGFFEDIIAISAKEAMDSIKLHHTNQGFDFHQSLLTQYDKNQQRESTNDKATQLFTQSNIQAVLHFLFTSIRPQAIHAKEYRILRELRVLVVREKRKLHRINLVLHDLAKILQVYTEKVRFNALQSRLDKEFQQLFIALDSKFDTLTQKIFNSFEIQTFDIIRESKNTFGIKKKHTQTKEVNVLPREKLLSQLHNDENEIARDLKKFGFSLSEFGKHFAEFLYLQIKELQSDLETWRDVSLQFVEQNMPDVMLHDKILEQYFRIEFLRANIFYDYEKVMQQCVVSLHNELNYLQKSLADNFQNTILLCLEKLHFEVSNALAKHRSNPDVLPLYNPTLENVRDLINLGFHFNIYQEKLSLNFPLYKKALWNLTQELTKMYAQKHELISQWIQNNADKYSILQQCEDSIKHFKSNKNQ